MRTIQFRISTPTVGIDRPGSGATLLHIPAGSAVKVIGELPNADSLVAVEWNGRKVLMFARDLRDRAEPISE